MCLHYLPLSRSSEDDGLLHCLSLSLALPLSLDTTMPYIHLLTHSLTHSLTIALKHNAIASAKVLQLLLLLLLVVPLNLFPSLFFRSLMLFQISISVRYSYQLDASTLQCGKSISFCVVDNEITTNSIYYTTIPSNDDAHRIQTTNFLFSIENIQSNCVAALFCTEVSAHSNTFHCPSKSIRHPRSKHTKLLFLLAVVSMFGFAFLFSLSFMPIMSAPLFSLFSFYRSFAFAFAFAFTFLPFLFRFRL